MRLGGGSTATASIELKCLDRKRGRVYAYLRWHRGGRQNDGEVIGPVVKQARVSALAEAWRSAVEMGLLNQSG